MRFGSSITSMLGAGDHAATGQAALLRNPFPGMRPALAQGLTEADLPRLTLLQEDGQSAEREWRHWLPLLGHPPDAGQVLRFERFN